MSRDDTSTAGSAVHEDLVSAASTEQAVDHAAARADRVADPADSADPVVAWAESLDAGADNDTMLRFTPSRHNAVDLTDANSSGQMQLFAGRRTRLSTLLIEDAAFATGREAVAAIRAKVREMSEERGIDVGHLAAGVAGWTEETAAGVEQFTAPVMLVPVSLRPRPDGDDFEVQFTAPARLNPALARHLADRHGLVLDPAEFEAAGYATARFDPSRTSELLDRLVARHAGESGAGDGALGSLQVWDQVYLSTFADVSGLGRPAGLDSSHPVLRALAASEPLSQPEADAEAQAAPSLDDRDPQDERLVVDADADQQAVLDAVAAGQSMVVSAPPGTGQTQTAVNAVAALAWAGKRTLVVSERAAAVEEFTRRLSQARLGTLALQVPASTTTEDLRQQLIRAIKRVERSEPPRLTGLQERLRERRHELVDHVDSLHQVRSRWSCSPYQAMQALAALTSLNPAPSTSVRLKRSVLDTTVDRSQVTVKLARAAELGAFSAETRRSPWYNARPRNRQETDDAAALVARLREELPQLKGHMETAAAVTGLRPGTSFSDWHAQVMLFQRVQESLGKFAHDVYTKPVDDLIAATAPGWWRKQHGVEMTSIARSRLRRVAKEYIRPGVSIHDLHTSLVEVQTEREEWAEHAVDEVRPKVPKNLDRLADAVGAVQAHLEKLVEVLDPDVAERHLHGVAGGSEPAGGDGAADSADSGRRTLLDIPFARMVDVVEALAEDQEPLETLPERTLVTEQLREQGFRELMEDLAEREVPAERVADELELAWWQSTLEAMISGDDYLAMTSGENLRRIEEEFRAADAAHIEAGARRLDHSLSVRWKSAVEAHPQAAARLKELLREGSPTVAALDEVADELVQPLVPVWTSSPLGLVEQFPEDLHADAVVLLDAESLSTASALGAITRGAQVVAFGDPATGAPKPLQISADPTAPAVGREVPESILDRMVQVLPVHRLRRVHRGVDQELTEQLSEEVYDGDLMRLPDAAQLTGQGRRLTVESLAESSAVPSAGDVPDSPTREVNRVVDMVFDHIRSRRDASLAVITGSERHARRVADALKVNLANHSWARGFFEAEGRERFVVAPVERAHHLVRDQVIFSLGFGRGVSGDPVREFGALSGPRGREYAAVAATRAREQLRLVTSLTPDQLDVASLAPGAALVMRLIDRGLRGGGNPTASATLTDPLVLDLVDRIRARGGRVEDGFHGTLDLAACPRKISPQVPVTPVAMVSDGTDGYAAMSVRERSRQNPEQFEQLGWTHVVLWTIEVFTDPARCTETVAEKVGLAAGPEFAEHGRIALKTTGALADREPEEAVGARVRFGGAADVGDEDSRGRTMTEPSPRQRGRTS